LRRARGPGDLLSEFIARRSKRSSEEDRTRCTCRTEAQKPHWRETNLNLNLHCSTAQPAHGKQEHAEADAREPPEAAKSPATPPLRTTRLHETKHGGEGSDKRRVCGKTTRASRARYAVRCTLYASSGTRDSEFEPASNSGTRGINRAARTGLLQRCGLRVPSELERCTRAPRSWARSQCSRVPSHAHVHGMMSTPSVPAMGFWWSTSWVLEPRLARRHTGTSASTLGGVCREPDGTGFALSRRLPVP
jgi:hypothetical protein